MSLQWRVFVEPDDAGVLIELMQRMTPWNEAGAGWLHPGDVVWRLYQNLASDPDDEMRVISDETGRAVALVEVLEPDTLLCAHAGGRGGPGGGPPVRRGDGRAGTGRHRARGG